jgi:hypothetical protein
MHLIATLVSMFFIVILWRWNHKLININHRLRIDKEEFTKLKYRISEKEKSIKSLSKEVFSEDDDE